MDSDKIENIAVLILIVLAAWGVIKIKDRLNKGDKVRLSFFRVWVLYLIVCGIIALVLKALLYFNN